jgi:hypothetical protein
MIVAPYLSSWACVALVFLQLQVKVRPAVAFWMTGLSAIQQLMPVNARTPFLLVGDYTIP